MADKGSSTAKISLVANFEQNNIKAMGKQLSDGIKTSLKDIKLDTVFDDADILGGVKKEIESINGLLKNRTLNRLDFSSMIPPLAQALEDSSLSEQIRLQIIQGFREGLESGRTFLQGMPSGMTGDEIKAQFRQSAIMSDAVDSLPGLNKNQRSAFKKQWASITENDIRQLMATMDIADEYQDVLPYLLDVENLGKMVMENITSDKAGAPQKVVAAIARLQEMADKEEGKGKQSKLLDKLFSTQVQGGTVEQIYKDLLKSIPTLGDLYARVYDASIARDNARENIPKVNATIENLLSKTLQRGYKNGSLQKMEPLYTGNYKTPAHITLSDLIEASNRETNTGGGEESPVVQNIDEQIANIDAQIVALKEQETQLSAKKASVEDSINEAQTAINEIQEILSFRQQPNDVIQKTSPQDASKILRQKAQEYKDLMKEIHATEREMKKEAKLEGIEESETSSGMYLTELQDKQTLLWNQFYDAYQTAKQVGVSQSTLNANVPEKKGDKNNPFDDKTATLMKDDLEQLLSNYQSSLELWNNTYPSVNSKYDKVIKDIEELSRKRETLKQKLNSQDEGEVIGSQSQPPLSSSGAETASGVQEEGNEAGDAAEKMQALAQAKKEALEANQKLAESANTTQKAIQNESSAGDFNTLILALTEIYELLSQLPQSFDRFKNFDLTGFTEPLNTLSQTIQQFPKEGFNISLGDSFDNLANRINEVLQKLQELTSEAKIAEIEGNITQKYDEQIKQLKADAEEAKRVIEELKRTKQDAIRDEYDPRLDSSSEQYAPKEVGREIAARAKRNPDTDVDALIKEYGNLKRAQEKLFTIDSADEYSAALERREEILQRILELEQKIALSDVGQAQIDNLLMGYGEDASPSFSALDAARNAAQKSSIGRLSKNYTDQQKAEIKAMSDSLSSINIIPKDVQSNWSKKRREEYNQIAEGAQTASQAIETLNANLAAMEANGANPEVLKTFLQLKESTAQMVKDTQDKSNVFGESIEAASTRLLDRLSNIETRLQVIKRDSGKLINVDPALAGALETIEKHLNKIQDLKNTVSNDPLQAINPQFTRSINSYLAQMEGKGKSESVVEGLEQTSDRSQADFSRMTTNYGKYASALKKLFDDMSKGAGASLKNLEEDLARVDELATRLTGSTGLERNNLLTGELNSKAAPKVVDAQIEAASKASIAYESMLTKIESKAESAQSKISSIFGTDGITEGLKSNFVEGMAKGFDDFVNSANQAGTALQHLQEIQSKIRDDKTWATQKENIIDYQQTMDTLESSLKKVTENAGNFKIVDDLDVQKLRASTTQFIKDNPALSGSDISQFNGYIDQLQGRINSVDFKNIEDGIQRVKQSAIEAGRTGDTFMSMLTQRFKSLGAYLLSFVSFYEVIGVFKEGLGIIHELDDALTEMQKVSDESLSSLREYQKSTFDTANNIGTTAAQLQTSTADWMRLGEDLQTASQSAQTANVLFNVSEFDNIDDATEALVAMSAAYENAETGLEKMDIVDRLNLIGNNYSIATDGLATALQDSASVLTQSGNDLNQALALITAGELYCLKNIAIYF